MIQTDDTLRVPKLLTCVFDDDAPLPEVERLDLTDGIYIAPIPPFLLQADDNYCVMDVKPQFSQFFRSHLHKSTLNVVYQGNKNLNDEGVKTEEAAAKQKIWDYLFSAMLFSPYFLAPYASFVTMPEEKRICHSSRMMDFGCLESLNQQPLTDADFQRINDLYGSIKGGLSDVNIGRLPTAFSYYQQAFRMDIHLPVRFLGMMMGMEALFSHGATKISRQVPERTAAFLKQSPDKQKALYDEMCSHYKLRSKIAHGATSIDGGKKLEGSFEQLLVILRDALVRIVEDSEMLTIFISADRNQFKEKMLNLDLDFCGTVTPES